MTIASPKPLLELCDVSHRAGGRSIVRQLNWKVQHGEHWAILGPNGAGKTTLLRIASGYQWPNDGGHVLRMGKELIDLAVLRRSIGWVSSRLVSRIPLQEPALETVISGRFGQWGLRRQMVVGELTEEHEELAAGQLAQLGALPLSAQPFGTLSQGEQQKVLLARARMAEPLLIFLDEPCAGLDPAAREQFLEDLQLFAEQEDRVSLVMVTHHLEEIMPAFARLLTMKDGEIVSTGDTRRTLSPDLLVRLYGKLPQEVLTRNGRMWTIW